MRKQLNVTKSRGGDVFVPMTSINAMATTGDLPMALKESVEVAD